jgi:hypothetical protein
MAKPTQQVTKKRKEKEHVKRIHKRIKCGDSQDRIICQTVKLASLDNGESWEPLRFCTAEDQQDPERGMLWVGVLSATDRSLILDKAMKGHKEAATRLASFRS